MAILNSLNQMQDEMKEWRRDLHKIPEIGLEEHKTSKYIKDKLSIYNKEKEIVGTFNILKWCKQYFN